MYINGEFYSDEDEIEEIDDLHSFFETEVQKEYEIPELPKDPPDFQELYKEKNSNVEAMAPAEALSKIKDSLSNGTPICLTVSGTNMIPFLYDQDDRVIIAPVKRRLREGDIIFYVRAGSTPVLQRVVKIPEPKQYLVCGDAQTDLEKINRSQIIGLVTDVVKNNEYHSCSAFSWRAISRIWIWLRPMRPRLLRFISFYIRFRNK